MQSIVNQARQSLAFAGRNPKAVSSYHPKLGSVLSLPTDIRTLPPMLHIRQPPCSTSLFCIPVLLPCWFAFPNREVRSGEVRSIDREVRSGSPSPIAFPSREVGRYDHMDRTVLTNQHMRGIERGRRNRRNQPTYLVREVRFATSLGSHW